MNKPTREQQKVIDSQAREIKVSANAGSGKTFTIMQQIAQIVKTGNSRVDQLLVLTFTEASAKDMRKKLKEQLGDIVKPAELQAASIGTFHSFCSSIVRAWFTVAEVSPSFAVMDAVESAKIKAAIFEQVVLEHYAKIAKVVDLFTASSRKLDQLRKVVFEIQDFLDTREDRADWLKRQALTAYEPDINQNQAIQALINYYHHTAEKYRAYFLETGTPSPMLDSMVDLCNRILGAQTYADFGGLDLTFPAAKSGELKTQSDAFRKLREDFRDKLCRTIPETCQYPVAQITADINTERVIVEQLLLLVQVFDQAYQAKKAEAKKLDFSDLEKYALKVLGNPEALTSIRAQFKYIFVDEGQDTNPVQFKIINLLRGTDKFFCIVGDVKQSIYGFRACEPEIFESLTDEDGNLVPVLLLGKNFRSTDPILHFVNMVMKPLIPHYMEDHKFTEIGEPNPEAMQQAVVLEAAKTLPEQMELVYRHIVAEKNLAWQDIVVLSETSGHLLELQKYLSERGISAVIDRKTNALLEPEITLLNDFLFAAMNPTNELKRYLVLQYLFHFSNDDLARLRLGQMDDQLTARLNQCDAIWQQYRQLGRSASAYEVLTQAATEFGMLEIPVVSAFLAAIRGVRDFDTVARYLYLIEHYLVKIEVNVGAYAQNAVKLMTIHNSKGLEFPMVILFNMSNPWSAQSNERSNVKVVYDKRLGVCVSSVDTENYVLKSPVLHLGIKKYQQEIEVKEKIRLLYVALTRAKKKMVIIGSDQGNRYAVQPNCMMHLINPLTMHVYEDGVELSPKLTTTMVKSKTKITTCPVVGHPDALVKQSVTALATSAEPFQDYVAPQRFADVGGKEFGTVFHRQVQYGDLPEPVAELVTGYTVYREIPFLYPQGQTIVQGIMDLLAVKDNAAIIVDYKTTRLPKDQLVAKYREQLRLYAQAVPNYQVRAYLYSTVHKALIEVKF